MVQRQTVRWIADRWIAAACWVAVSILFVVGCSEPPHATPLDAGQSAFASGQWSQAISDCSEAIRRNPQEAAAHLLRGRAYHCLGKLDPAIVDFSEAIRLNPGDPEPYYQRANAYRDSGETVLQLADEKRGRELDASYQQAYLFAPTAPSETDLPDEPAGVNLSTSVESPADLDSGSRSPASKQLRSTQRPPAERKTATESLFDSTGSESSATAQQEPPVKDIYGLPMDVAPRSKTEELLGIEIPRSSAATGNQFGAPVRGEPGIRRRVRTLDVGDDDFEPPALGEIEARERQRAATANSSVVPPLATKRRSTNPYGATQMRPTGMLPEFEESGDELPTSGRRYGVPSDPYSGRSRQYGSSPQAGGTPQYGGGAGYRGPIDPYGGYNRSTTPYGAAGGRSAVGSSGRNPYSPGAGSPIPYTPAPGGQAPYVPPAPGLRYD